MRRLPHCLVAACIAAAVVLLGIAMALTTPWQLDARVRDAAERCLGTSHLGVVRYTSATANVPLTSLAEYPLIQVSAMRSDVSGYCQALIARDGRVFVLPSEFGSFLAAEGITASDSAEARAIAATLAVLAPPALDAVVIDSASDIPGVEALAPQAGTISAIQPMKVTHTPGGFQVSLTTWEALGGHVVRWTIDVPINGTVRGSPYVIDRAVGAAQFMPGFDRIVL